MTRPHTLAHSTFKGTLYAKYLPATNATQLFDHPSRGINDFFAVITGRLPEGDTYRDGGFRHYAVTYAEAAQAGRRAA